MEWTESIRGAIEYMETHLLDDIGADQVADAVHISSFYLQKGFKVMTGYTISEYIRCRRLYLAALDVTAGREKVIDLAYKYGYDTPESFTKAFKRFHGVSPVQMGNDSGKIRTFLPLKVKITIQGGNEMDFTVEKMDSFQVIGFSKEFPYEDSYQTLPQFWDEIRALYFAPLCVKGNPETGIEKAICENGIGEFGLCMDGAPAEGMFRYIIAGRYQGGNVPEGMTLCEVPAMEWAKFRCVGPMPGALQAVNTRIFDEWLPGNPEYEVAMGCDVEWYSQGDMSEPDYESAIWIPVKRKK